LFTTHIERTGEVIHASDGQLLLQFERTSSCGSCNKHSVCGTKSLGQGAAVQLSLPATGFGYQMQENTAIVELPTGGFGHILALCYLMLPVCMLLGAWLLSQMLGDSDLVAACGTLVGLAVGCFVLWLYDAQGGGQRLLRKLIIRPSGVTLPDRTLSN
jgi:positive regulator of sigma E activity